MATEERLIPTRHHNPCPICGDTSGDCRTKDDLILCHSFIDGGEGNQTHHYLRSTKDCIWGIFVPRQEKTTKAERDRYRLIQQAKRQERLEREERKFSQGLTREERDIAIRRLATVGLLSKHREQLQQRGLTNQQIKESLFFSVYPRMAVPVGVSEKLPGVDNGAIATNKTGYACVAFDHQGQAIGFQIRDEEQEAKNKYTWAKGIFSSHLQTGELPLSIAGTITDAVLLCEGTLKPRVASYRFGGIRFIGASGGNFAGSPLQLKAAIGACRRIILCPDAGDIINPHTLRRWKRTLSLFNHNYRVEVAWWGQKAKDGQDIDELNGWSGVEFLKVNEWEAIANDNL